ncbi:MAG: glycosyl hydrolase [Victivallaceae bacterium]|jgi:hypothetical protein
MKKQLVEDVKNPSAEYRGTLFWALNGKLEPEEMRRQIRLMKQMGLGGFFLHARVGLNTEYLGDEWFKCVDAAVDEASKLGMKAWLYDEDRWPSGAAGGLVTQHPEYRMRKLCFTEITDLRKTPIPDDAQWLFLIKKRDEEKYSYEKLSRRQIPGSLKKNEMILACNIKLDAPNSWFNGQTYLDTMNPDAVKKFIEVTHETYLKRCGKDFGGVIPGIFTDEPEHGQIFPQNQFTCPWTGRLPMVFKQRYGYELTDRLPELWMGHPDGKMNRIAYHYCDCTTTMFVEAFSRQIGEWCEKNKLLFTGHLMCEDSLSFQTCYVGACMPHYEYMQAPGMDELTEYWRIYSTVKQLSSAARQFGKKWRLSETYGCTGWDFPFKGYKALSDWQAALGVNLRCMHLGWYTMEAEAKRDYPAAIFYQSPWWQVYSKVEDYFARINRVMISGEEVRDILVIHPVESVWTLVRKNWWLGENRQHDAMFVKMQDTLLEAGLDFDYGDETIMARHGKVAIGRKPALAVGQASYKVVIVSPMLTIRSTTLELLRQFKASGGTVIFAGDVPAHVDALASDDAIEFAAGCVRTSAYGAKLAAAAEPGRAIALTEPSGRKAAELLYLLKEDSGSFYLFVCNTGLSKQSTSPKSPQVCKRLKTLPEVAIRGFDGCLGAPLEVDPATGEFFTARYAIAGKQLIISTGFSELGSRLFIIPKNKQQESFPQRPSYRTVREITLKRDRYPVMLSEENVLVLDRPSCKIGDGNWKKPDEILRIDRQARESLGLAPRGGAMVQPWLQKINPAAKTVNVILKYEIEIKTLPAGPLYLGIERPGTFTITINGYPVSADMQSGWWTDCSLKKLPVNPAILRTGGNELLLSCDYSENHPGFESIFLLGDFGVKLTGFANPEITAPAKSLRCGDWTKQGLPFYSGTVSYPMTFKNTLKKGEVCFISLPDFQAPAARIFVNGTEAGVIAWEPAELDITPFLRKGVNEIIVELFGHRRNSHGPLHLADRNPVWTGPGQFQTTGEQWQDEYVIKPCGLRKAPVIQIKKKV